MRAVNFPGMRHINRSIVLNIIREHGPISRGEIARRSQLAPSAVSNIVAELTKLGLVREGVLAKSRGGRPASLVELNAGSAYAIGLNVGLTTIEGVLTDLRGRVVGRVAATHERVGEGARHDPHAVMDHIAAVARRLVTEAGLHREHVVGAGVGVPGLVDSQNGHSRFSPNLGWRDIPVRRMLEARLNLPVHVDNDVRAATLGEREFGAGEQARHMVALFVGSAIGAGLILDGRLYYGAGEGAGEVGHIAVKADGPLCSCGNRGCLEAVASGRAIARRARALLEEGAPFTHLRAMLPDIAQVSAEEVSKAAAAGDSLAAEIMADAAKHIGKAVTFLVNTYNPERVIIGGGVARAGEQILGPIREMVAQEAMPLARDGVKILRSRLGSDAGPLGAAALVMRSLFPSIQLAKSDLIAERS